jgi:hypothetical protein
MKKTKKSNVKKKKLVIRKDVIRTLGTETLVAVAGGSIQTWSISTCPECYST